MKSQYVTQCYTILLIPTWCDASAIIRKCVSKITDDFFFFIPKYLKFIGCDVESYIIF